MRARFFYKALTPTEIESFNEIGRLFQLNEKGILFNDFLFDEINNLQDIINTYGQGGIAFIDKNIGAHTRVASEDEAPINFPEIRQRIYWIKNSSKVLSCPEIWGIGTAKEKWLKIRDDMQTEWNSQKSMKHVYIHFRYWHLFDFWWTQHYSGKRMRMGYYKGAPQVVSFILKKKEILNMTKEMVNNPFIERLMDAMKRKRIPMFDKIQPLKDRRNEFFVPPKYVLDPETVLQYY